MATKKQRIITITITCPDCRSVFATDDDYQDHDCSLLPVPTTTTSNEKRGPSVFGDTHPTATSSQQNVETFLMKLKDGVVGGTYVPPKLANQTFSKVIGRSKAIHSLIDVWASIHSGRIPNTPQRCPFPAIASCPGGGKSRFIDEITKVISDTKELTSIPRPSLSPLTSEQWNAALDHLSHAVVIPITFNSLSPLSSYVSDVGLHAVITRMLWTYFVCPKPFEPFAKQMSTIIISMTEACEAILHHSKASIILCVDELLLLTGEYLTSLDQSKYKYVNEVISSLGKASDTLPFFAIVTTLNRQPLQPVLTTTRRPIRWIPLMMLDYQEILTTLYNDTPASPLPSTLRMLIAEANGHHHVSYKNEVMIDEWLLMFADDQHSPPW
jgi:hypothetical protein